MENSNHLICIYCVAVTVYQNADSQLKRKKSLTWVKLLQLQKQCYTGLPLWCYVGASVCECAVGKLITLAFKVAMETVPALLISECPYWFVQLETDTWVTRQTLPLPTSPHKPVRVWITRQPPIICQVIPTVRINCQLSHKLWHNTGVLLFLTSPLAICWYTS